MYFNSSDSIAILTPSTASIISTTASKLTATNSVISKSKFLFIVFIASSGPPNAYACVILS